MMDPALIISITSLTMSSIVAFASLKISRENHKMRKQEFLREQRKYEKEQFDIRPRLEIIYYKKTENYNKDNESEIDINCLVVPIMRYKKENGQQLFEYDEKVLDKSEWVSIDLKLKNTGKSRISYLDFSWNFAKSTALFDVQDDQYKEYIKEKMLNYSVLLEKEIRQNQEFTIRINFHKEYISSGLFTAEGSFWLFDEYNQVWNQPVFVHRNTIYDSSKSTHKEFKNMANIDAALDCFEKPYLW